MEQEMKENQNNLPQVADNRDSQVEPSHEPERKVSTEGFVGILFAVVALGIMFWVGIRLMEPYPGGKSPERAAEEASLALEKITSDSKEPETQAAFRGTKGEMSSELASNEKDPVCGMNPTRSAARVEVEYSDGSKVAHVSLACFLSYERQMEKHGMKVVKARVVTFDSWQSEKPKLVDVQSAVYLVDIESLPEGSMPPGVVAFASVEDAKKFQPNLGGLIATYEEMKKYVEDFLDKAS